MGIRQNILYLTAKGKMGEIYQIPQKQNSHEAYIYISLYGLCETKQISQKIREELHPILYSKGAKIAKMVLIGTINTFSNFSFDINGDGNADDLSKIFDANSLFSILSKPNDRITGNKIVIFDDLERCKICLDEVFGYINDLVEHSKCHVILLCDEGILEKNLSTTNATIKYPAFKDSFHQTKSEDLPETVGISRLFS